MGLRSVVRKYKAYETKTLSEREERKKKLSPYNSLADGITSAKKPKKKFNLRQSLVSKHQPVKKSRKFSVRKFTKAMGNPYETKFPKTAKELEKIKKAKIKKRKRKRRKKKVIIVYR